MQKRALTIAAVAILGLAGSALAQENDPNDSAHGFWECTNLTGDDGTPGQMFQAIQDFSPTFAGLNPAEIWGPQQGVTYSDVIEGAGFPTLGPGATYGYQGALGMDANCNGALADPQP